MGHDYEGDYCVCHRGVRWDYGTVGRVRGSRMLQDTGVDSVKRPKGRGPLLATFRVIVT